MPIFTDWTDCNEILDAMAKFFANTAEPRQSSTLALWFESTKELLDLDTSDKKTVGVWTTGDIVFAGFEASRYESAFKSCSLRGVSALCEVTKRRKDQSQRLLFNSNHKDLKSLLEDQSDTGLLKERLSTLAARVGLPRNITVSMTGGIETVAGPSQTLATASALRALLLGPHASDPELLAAITWLVDCLLDPSPVGLFEKGNTPSAEELRDFVPNVVPDSSGRDRDTGYFLKSGMAVRGLKGAPAWCISPANSYPRPDPITTVLVLESLMRAATAIPYLGNRITPVVQASVSEYLLPAIIELLARGGSVSNVNAAVVLSSDQELRRFSKALLPEHLTYSDVTRLLSSLSAIRTMAAFEISHGTLGLIHLLTTKLIEKVFLDLAVFHRSPHDRLATQFVSGTEVVQWPGIDLSFICEALLLGIPHARQLDLQRYTSVHISSPFFTTPLCVAHPVVRVAMLSLESQILAASDIARQETFMASRLAVSVGNLRSSHLERFIGGMVWGGSSGDDLYAYEDIYFWETAHALRAFVLYIDAITSREVPTEPTGATRTHTRVLVSTPFIESAAFEELRSLRADQGFVPVGRRALSSGVYDWFYRCALLLLLVVGTYRYYLRDEDFKKPHAVLEWLALGGASAGVLFFWCLALQIRHGKRRSLGAPFIYTCVGVGLYLFASYFFVDRVLETLKPRTFEQYMTLGIFISAVVAYSAFIWKLSRNRWWALDGAKGALRRIRRVASQWLFLRHHLGLPFLENAEEKDRRGKTDEVR